MRRAVHRLASLSGAEGEGPDGAARARLVAMFQKALIPGFEAQIALEALAWRATKTPGVSWILVSPDESTFRARGPGAPGEVVALIRMDPGRGYPAHRHLAPEEVLVLAGGYRDEQGEHRAGSWVRYPAGSEHAPVALGDAGAPVGEGNPACVLFATARGGVELSSEAGPEPG